MVDDRRGIILPGEIASESTVFRVQGVNGVGVSDIPPLDVAREGNRGEMSLGYQFLHQRATHL